LRGKAPGHDFAILLARASESGLRFGATCRALGTARQSVMALTLGQFDREPFFDHSAADERTIGESARRDEMTGAVAVKSLAAQALGIQRRNDA
jgi:hypothetical protein